MDEQGILDRNYTIKAKLAYNRPNTYDVVFERKSDGQNVRGSSNQPETTPNSTKVEISVLENGIESRMVRRHPEDSGIRDEAFKEKAKKKVEEEFNP
jgi:hypothetical protein